MLDPGFLAAALLVVVVLMAAAIVGWLNIRGARGPRERRFVQRACGGAFVLLLLFIASIVLLHPPYQYVAPLIVTIIMTAAIYRWSTIHQLIREIEQRDRAKARDPAGADSA